MSMLRKTVVATALIGAGLGTMSGAAMANDHQGSDAKGCSNSIKAESENGSGRSLGDTTGGDQALDASNLCDIANGNLVGSGNNVAGGDITNGDTETITDISNEETTETTTTEGVPAGGAGGLGGLGALDGILGAIFGA